MSPTLTCCLIRVAILSTRQSSSSSNCTKASFTAIAISDRSSIERTEWLGMEAPPPREVLWGVLSPLSDVEVSSTPMWFKSKVWALLRGLIDLWCCLRNPPVPFPVEVHHRHHAVWKSHLSGKGIFLSVKSYKDPHLLVVPHRPHLSVALKSSYTFRLSTIPHRHAPRNSTLVRGVSLRVFGK